MSDLELIEKYFDTEITVEFYLPHGTVEFTGTSLEVCREVYQLMLVYGTCAYKVQTKLPFLLEVGE